MKFRMMNTLRRVGKAARAGGRGDWQVGDGLLGMCCCNPPLLYPSELSGKRLLVRKLVGLVRPEICTTLCRKLDPTAGSYTAIESRSPSSADVNITVQQLTTGR